MGATSASGGVAGFQRIQPSVFLCGGDGGDTVSQVLTTLPALYSEMIVGTSDGFSFLKLLFKPPSCERAHLRPRS